MGAVQIYTCRISPDLLMTDLINWFNMHDMSPRYEIDLDSYIHLSYINNEDLLLFKMRFEV